jgi:thioredoxin 1
MSQKVTSNDFSKEVLEADGLVLVDFWAAWCGPCIALGPIIEDVAEEAKDKVKVVKLNVDENPDIAQRYQIRGIPNVKLFKGGEVVQDMVGLMPKQSYLAAIESNS